MSSFLKGTSQLVDGETSHLNLGSAAPEPGPWARSCPDGDREHLGVGGGLPLD